MLDLSGSLARQEAELQRPKMSSKSCCLTPAIGKPVISTEQGTDVAAEVRLRESNMKEAKKSYG